MQIFATQDGSHSLIDNTYGVSYHSRYGALNESYHVFINAALRYRACLKNELSILEIGFGTGLNVLLSYLEAKKRNLNIQFCTVEAFPIDAQVVEQLNYPQLLDISPKTFKAFHKQDWNSVAKYKRNFGLEKLKQRFENLDFDDQFDIIYFDAFAPESQPELWDEAMMASMFKALKPEGILVTYCAKGVVKRTMKKVGFTIEALKGPPGKREMTRAEKPLAED